MSEQLPKVRNKRYKGEADTDFVAADGYFVESKDIDTLANPKYVKLSPKPITVFDKTSDPSWDGAITIFSKFAKIINISSNPTGAGNSKIYVDGVDSGTISSAVTVYKAIEFQNKIFFAYLRSGYEFPSVETIHYGFVDMDPVTGGVLTIYNPNEWRVEGFGTYNVELHNLNDALLLFGAGNKIRAVKRPLLVSPTGGTYPCDVTTATLTLRKRDNIVGIRQFQEQFRIYCTYGNRDNPQTSCAYIANQADIENGTFTQKIDYAGLNLKAILTNGPVDYAIAKDGDYLISGGQKPIKLTSSASFTDFRRENVAMRDDCFVTTLIRNSDYNIRIYGAQVAGFPDHLTTLNSFTSIKSLSSGNGKIIVSGVYNGVKGVFYASHDPDNTLTKVDTGYITTMKFYGSLAGTLKKTEQFTIGQILPTGTSIALQIGINEGAFQTVKTFSGADYENSTRALLFANDLAENSNEWGWMQLKIVLNSSVANRVLTPFLMDILMLYTDIIKGR